VLAVRLAAGVKIAVLLAATYVTVPVTAVAPGGPVNVNVAVVIVAAFIGSLKVVEIAWFSGTPVAPFAGTVEVTVGMAPVVNLQTKLLASALPAGSLAPVVMVPVNVVLGGRLAAGVNVAVALERTTAPETSPPELATVKVAVLMVAGSIASLKVTVIIWVIGTQVARFAGFVEITVGARNPVCSRPQPPAKTLSTITNNHALLALNMCMRVSSLIRDEAFPGTTARHQSQFILLAPATEIHETPSFTGCSIINIRLLPHAYTNF